MDSANRDEKWSPTNQVTVTVSHHVCEQTKKDSAGGGGACSGLSATSAVVGRRMAGAQCQWQVAIAGAHALGKSTNQPPRGISLLIHCKVPISDQWLVLSRSYLPTLSLAFTPPFFPSSPSSTAPPNHSRSEPFPCPLPPCRSSRPPQAPSPPSPDAH